MDSESTTVRSPPEVARRILLLACVTGLAMGVERELILSWVEEEGLWEFATPSERAFLSSPAPSERDQIYFSWQAEAVFVLGWALGLVADLPPPKEQASIGAVLDQMPMPGEAVKTFVDAATLRPAAEIIDAAENAEVANAYCRVAKSEGTPERHGYDIEVAQERHRALNWLICCEDADWDEVPTDT